MKRDFDNCSIASKSDVLIKMYNEMSDERTIMRFSVNAFVNRCVAQVITYFMNY